MILQQTSSKLFRNVKSKERITEKEVKYFTIDFNKAIKGFIYCPSFTNFCLKFQVGTFKLPYSCRTPFWIVSLNLLCEKVGIM